jgi:predicted RNA-binding protein YlqC (UPF0109 family)
MASQSPRTGAPVKVFEGVLDLEPTNMGLLFGRNGEALRKYVTGKSFHAIKKAYGEDFAAALKAVDGNTDDKSVRFKTDPEDLGRILVKVNFPSKEELEGKDNVPYTVEILCDTEDLNSPKFHEIVKKNMDTHAKNCSIKKAPEDKFTHKMVFTADLDHEGMIGRFVGARGKNIRALSDEVKEALGVSYVRICMNPASEPLARGPWKGKFIRLDTHEDNAFSVNIIVAANLPGGRQANFKDTMKVLVPVINAAVQRLEGDRFSGGGGGDTAEIMASEFLDGLSERPASPSYLPEECQTPPW